MRDLKKVESSVAMGVDKVGMVGTRQIAAMIRFRLYYAISTSEICNCLVGVIN